MRSLQRLPAIVLSAACVLMFNTPVVAAIAGLAQDSTAMATVNVQVYKKWIGASGDEADVEIRLFCGQGEKFEPRFIHPDRPDGWQISAVPADGLFCNVREIVRDTFMADVSDCLDLLVIPGQEVECTIVNTKVVKRIDMLNRYGLAMMIAVMLGAGLAAVRRFTPM